MGKWIESKVGDCISEIQTGKTPPKSQNKYYQNVQVDWFSPSDFDDDKKILSDSKNKISEIAVLEGKAKIYPINSLLLVGIGATIGKVGIIKYDASSNQQITALSFKKDINPDYAYYWFRNLKEYIINMSSSATMPIINQKEIKNLPFKYPNSLPEQQRIVAKLDGLFAKIDQAITLLEANLQHTQALMGSVLDEEFGRLENVYEAKPLAQIVKVINGRAYKKVEMLDSGKYPILRVGNFFSNRGWYYSDMELNEDKYCEKGDLLYAWSASFGPKIWDGEKSIYHYHIWKLVPLNKEVSRKYLYYLLERDTEKIKEEGGRGVGMIHITKGGIEKRLMVLPPIEVQHTIVDRIERYYDVNNSLLETQTQKLNHLKALKSSLLDQAFKGEL